MSKQEEASLILRLYELRREEVMRTARDWYMREFHPESAADVMTVLSSAHSGHMRMVLSYWEMAAALVNHGAIDLELFNDTQGEYILVFATVEPILAEMRSTFGPHYLKNMEKLVDATPNGRQLTASMRERLVGVRARLAAAKAAQEQGKA